MTHVVDVLRRCTVAPDGFLATEPADGWRLGMLAHVSCGNALAMVRKAQPLGRDYEFANLWTLPGGMVRAAPDDPPAGPEALAEASLGGRVAKEAGLDLATCSDLGLSDRLGPLVSGYTTSIGYRHTLVLVRRFLSAPVELGGADRTVSQAAWAPVPPDWSTMAPVNLAAVAHLAWPGLGDEQRDEAAPHVARAVVICSERAHEIGVISVPVPWADEEDLTAWRSGFPG